jgi:sterol desaturase/sphingolipid hydroxylase (fatty acid hydroxylase superfamily)
MRPTPTLTGLAVAFAVAALLFGMLEALFAALPRQSIWRRDRRTDFLYWLFTPLATRAFGRGALFVAVALVTVAIGRPSSHWFASQPVALQALETLVAADFLGYWNHRAFHRGCLWRIHAIHHSAQTVDWLAAARVHPLGEAVTAIVQFVPLYLLGFNGRALAAALPLLTAYTVFLHANLRWDFGPLRYLLASPRFHRWHHTSQAEGLDRNFAGLFPWLDVLFGTFWMPKEREPDRFGVAEEVPAGLLGQLAWPFRRG